ncbi:MAG: hypothetical protein JWQ97_3745, partial [Phenylobacterium sp.]|nr:hypothetical protein [Phenylobacterium sp.]
MRRLLELHPDSPCEAVAGLAVEVGRSRSGGLALRYLLAGDLERLRLPPPGELARADELWRSTCFEAFVGAFESPAYVEINLAPSAQWATYSFTSYREGMRTADEIPPPRFQSFRSAEGYELRAVIDLGASGLPPAAPWRLAISTVLEEASGAKSYWALAHPPGKPDFHHP